MLKSLYPAIEWDDVACVGFDLDGTLYDECEFVAQAYQPIARELASHIRHGVAAVHGQLMRGWIEKGSSYNRLFEDILHNAGVSTQAFTAAITNCVEIYRAFQPNLTLPVRVATILDLMHSRFPLFLVSDGSLALQMRKFAALGLGRWFDAENTVMTAKFGAGGAKPATIALEHVAVLKNAPAGSRVVFFGDRVIDQSFATNAGFRFVRVHCMQAVAA